MAPVIRKQLRLRAESNAYTQNHFIEVLTGIQTVKAQNFELNARWKWKERYSRYIEKSYQNAITFNNKKCSYGFFKSTIYPIVLTVGSYLVIQGQLSLGQLIAFRIISGYVTTLLRLSGLYQNFQQTLISLERLADIIDTPQESTSLDKVNIPLPRINGGIVYEDVSFRFGKSGPFNYLKLR